MITRICRIHTNSNSNRYGFKLTDKCLSLSIQSRKKKSIQRRSEKIPSPELPHRKSCKTNLIRISLISLYTSRFLFHLVWCFRSEYRVSQQKFRFECKYHSYCWLFATLTEEKVVGSVARYAERLRFSCDWYIRNARKIEALFGIPQSEFALRNAYTQQSHQIWYGNL